MMSILRSIIGVALALLLCGARAAAAGPPPEPGIATWELAGGADWPRWLPLPVLRGHEYALPALAQGLRDADAQMRARCAFLVGQVGSPRGVPFLVPTLYDRDRSVRLFSGLSLCLLGDSRGLPAARAALIGTRWWVRYYAVISLWRLGGVFFPAEGLPSVPPGRDAERKRSAGAVGGGRLGGERARAALASALDDPDELVRAAARAALDAAPPQRSYQAFEADEPLTAHEFIFLATNYLVGEGDWWFHAGDYVQVQRCQEAAMFVDPTFVDLFGVAGWLYWSMDRNAEAVGAHRRGIEANPASWEVFFSLGFHYFNTGRFDDALPYLSRACELGAPPAWQHTYAHALEHAGRLEDSLREWQRLRALEPDSHLTPHHIERLRQRQGMGNGE